MNFNPIGLIPDTPNASDKLKVVAPGIVPQKASVKQWNHPAFNQGQIGACTGYSTAAAAFNLFTKLKGSPISWTPSPLWIYWRARIVEGTTGADGGAQLRDAFGVLHNDGVAMINDYDPADAFTPPPATLNPHLHIPGCERISVAADGSHTDEMIKVLGLEQLPIVIGIALFPSFESPETSYSGVVSIPTSTEKTIGNHAILIDGYDLTENVFTGQNSWGSTWGNNGGFTIPISYLKTYLPNDIWTFSNIYW